ncbi:probable cytochrome P450 308a1 [Drosophila busckii]|uniref:probable cytochrome P450 308a1 n=1 Tax=Drosophila busckii TaxID=30019 RepID=UPI00083E9C4F|nr:probable cytochrome P450 308a1 [Drosophila busckii]
MLLFILLLLLLLLLLCGWRSSHWWRNSVAGPLGCPLVGNMWQFACGLRSYGDIYAQLYNSYPELRYVGFYRLGNEPALLVRDQQLLRELLVGASFAHCADNALCLDAQRDALAWHNPFVACGDLWRQRRGELLPLFTPHRLRQCTPHIAQACAQLQQFVAQLPASGSFEAKQLATRYTLQVVASAVFGLNANCLEAHGDSDWLQLLAPLFQPSAWSLAETIALLHSSRLGWLLQHRYVPLALERWLQQMVAASLSSRSSKSLLHALHEKLGATHVAVAGHAATLLLEGYETSASLLAFALYELARNPLKQRRLQAELDAVAGQQLLSHEALESLSYAEATLYETLRLHPAMPALQKRCTESFLLPSQTAAGAALQVAKHTVLVLPVQAIHLDPLIYAEPLRFQPERFMQSQTPLGCRFLGFGAGPRMCPGMRLGLAQTKAALATLLQRYNVQLARGQRQAPVEKSTRTFLTSCTSGIWLSLQPRTTTDANA